MRPAFIAYLHNSVFPPLLCPEDEADCLARLAQGDEEARNKLIEHNLRLVSPEYRPEERWRSAQCQASGAGHTVQ